VSHRSSSSNKRNGLMSGLWWRESVRFCRLIPPRAPGTLALPPSPEPTGRRKKAIVPAESVARPRRHGDDIQRRTEASLGFFGFSTRVRRLRQGPPPASLPAAPAAATGRHSAGGVADASGPGPRRVPRSGSRRSRVGTSRVAKVAVGRLPELALGFRGDRCCFFAVPEQIGLPEPGPQFREGRGLFWPVAQVGLLVPRVAFHERLGRVVPLDKESRCDQAIRPIPGHQAAGPRGDGGGLPGP
jgi:hypothetical protein